MDINFMIILSFGQMYELVETIIFKGFPSKLFSCLNTWKHVHRWHESLSLLLWPQEIELVNDT